MAEKNLERIPEKVKEFKVKKEKGYLYFVDKDGDLARVPAKWNENPEFLEKKELNKHIDEKTILQSKENYSEAKTHHEEPIPVTDENIPSFFMDKIIAYKDNSIVELIGDEVITQAQLNIYPKKLSNLNKTPADLLTHMATASSISASIVFEKLGAKGTNIIFNEENNIIKSSVIPRFETDEFNLMWDIKPGDQNAIKSMAEKIKENLILEDEKEEEVINLDKKIPQFGFNDNHDKTNKIDEEKHNKKVNIIDKNYMIDHLRRDF